MRAIPIRGIVQTAEGKPVDGANIFVLETLEGTITRADGRFELTVTDSAPTIVARRLGFTPVSQKMTAGMTADIVLTLQRASPVLEPITVMASAYTSNEERTATLTPLEVVTIPGTAADVNRALQTLPGIQQVDEGTGLFVRGGDSNETKVFLNEAAMLNPLDIQSPNGTFMGTVDPFLLDGIVFSSGGFGARFGNALSATVNLRTQGRPEKRALSASIGLAGGSVSLAERFAKGAGARAAVNLFDLRPLIALNGSSHEYDPAPHGHDVSGSVTLTSHKRGELTLFGIDKTNRIGVAVDDPTFSGTFALSSRSRLLVGTWRASFNAFAATVAASVGSADKDELYGTFELDTRLRQRQAFAQLDWIPRENFTLRGGAEVERVGAAFEGTIPNTAIDVAPGSRIRKLGSDADGTRIAAFVESDTRIGARLRAVTGVRSDDSDLTNERTVDPRVSLAFKTKGSATLTAAWGVYHEIPDALLFDAVLGDPNLRSMRASHSIVGFQAGDNAEMVRVELYRKRYDNLTRQTRDYSVSTGGEGSAHGADLFLKGATVLGIRARVTYSYVRSQRTDANTGVMANAPFDVPHTVTLVAQKSVANWQFGTAYRFASGR
ncbi:MAG TPA: TonB-dependent receptor, partial [Gemmatimonadaceae bacterium]|nr:TonB-dependent receptor [Gemmatimonadaceae bacterium]